MTAIEHCRTAALGKPAPFRTLGDLGAFQRSHAAFAGETSSSAFESGRCAVKRGRLPQEAARLRRRYVDYPDAFAGWNYVSSVGVYISWVSTLIFFFGVAHAFFRRRQAEVNPCAPGATALKWTLPSPPPFHAFEELPRIK
jgi:hypothetical protein